MKGTLKTFCQVAPRKRRPTTTFAAQRKKAADFSREHDFILDIVRRKTQPMQVELYRISTPQRVVVEEPCPQNFPSKAWKQRLLLLA